MSKVTVAVRIRPPSKREREEGRPAVDLRSDNCIQVHNVRLESLQGGSEPLVDSRVRVKTFTFDHVYNSQQLPHSPSSTTGCATQQLVYAELGTKVLDAAFLGYNVCLFAYGQTGSGKTYTMMGDALEDQLGLIPRICESLFSEIDRKTLLHENSDEKLQSFHVSVSYVEIYNERPRDLLLSPKSEKIPLRIREHPKTGPYVQGLSHHVVNDNESLQMLIDKGNSNRTTAATHVHDRSSRSHAIFTISFTQATLDEIRPSETVSKINLVDLAGSERADMTSSSYNRGRLKEGANINRSLVALGNVIQALAQKSIMQSWETCSWSYDSSIDVKRSSSDWSSRRQRQMYIPYRDSALTWLLRDSLGGNAKTFMIATISPSSLCYTETINTLLYAQRAKNIVNKPVVNEDPVARLICELRAEIHRLQSLLLSQDGSIKPVSETPSVIAERLEENEIQASKLTKSFLDRWNDQQQLMEDPDLSITSLHRRNSLGVFVGSNLPHLICMDDDILSTGVKLYHLKDGDTHVGAEDADEAEEVDIVLPGSDILSSHCTFTNSSGEVILVPSQGAFITVNSHLAVAPVKLSQGDIIFLGRSHRFRFNNPQEAARLREKQLAQGGDGRLPGALSRCSSLSSVNTSSGIDVESPSDTASLSTQHLIRCLDGEAQLMDIVSSPCTSAVVDLATARKELDWLIAEQQRATETAMEKEEELYQLHESHLAEIAAQQNHLDQLKAQHEAEWDAAWREIELQRQMLEEQQAKGLLYACVDAEVTVTDGSKRDDAECSFSGNDALLELTKDVERRQKAVEEKYSEQMAKLKKAEEDLRVKEELYKHEDEARLEKLSAQNSFVEKLDVRKVQLMYFIEAQQKAVPAGFEISPSTSLFHSEGHLNEVCDGFNDKMHPQMPRTVSSASGRLLTTSKHRSLKDNPTQNGTTFPNSTSFTPQSAGYNSKQHHSRMLTVTSKNDGKPAAVQRSAFERPSNLCTSTGLFAPLRLLSDDPDIKSKSASAPHLSDETASASLISDETRSVLLSRLVRSPSPRNTRLSSVSLASVPESIHEEHEESPIYGRLSVSEVDIRRHEFSSSDDRNRWSLDEEHLCGQNTAASIRCTAGSDEGAVITDSGLPSSPEAVHLDSSVSCDINTTVKQKVKPSKQSGVVKSLKKSEAGILQKIGATLTSLTHRRQDTKTTSVKKQTPVVSSQSKVSHQQSDTGVVSDTHEAKIQTNANGGKKTTINHSKCKSKQPLSAMQKRFVKTSKGRLPSDSAEKKDKSASKVQDKPTMPAKVRESFRSFRQRLKLTAEKSLKRKPGDIPVEIFLPKPKVVEGSEDSRDLCAIEKQTYKAAGDACLSGEIMSQHMSSDIDWTHQWTDRFGVVPHNADANQMISMKVCDDDGQFSDDSLNGHKNNSYRNVAGLSYGHVIGQVYDNQYFFPYVQESVQTAFSDANSDDCSFSEDSLAEDMSSCSAGTAPTELGQKPTAVLLPCNTRSASPASAVACIAYHESETRHNQDIVESEEHSALCTSDEAVYKQCMQTGILPTTDLQVAPVSRDNTALQTETLHLNIDSTSASDAGRSTNMTKSSSKEAVEGKASNSSKRDARSQRAEILHALGKSTTESDVTEGTQPAASVTVVKRRKRRIPAVHDMMEPNVQSLSSDDYASSAADISSSSSSNEDNTDAVCRQHNVRKEMPSDHDNASVFWIPSTMPLGDGFVTTIDSKDSPTNAHPLFNARNLRFRCHSLDVWNNMNDMADASLKNDESSEANSPVAADSEQKFSAVECTVNIKFPQNPVLSHTPASSQNLFSALTAVATHSQDVLLMTEQVSGNTLSSISSKEDWCVHNSVCAEFDADTAAHFCAELLPSSSIATDISSDNSSSLCHERRPGAASYDVISRNDTAPENGAVQELMLSDNDGFCDELQQERDSSDNDRGSAEVHCTVLQFAEVCDQDSIYQSVFCQSAHSLEDSHTSEDETTLTVGNDKLVETARVEDDISLKQNLQVNASLGVEGSQNVQEEYIQSDGHSALAFFDIYDEVTDEFIVCESSEDGGNNEKNSEQTGSESLVAGGIESSDSDDEVVCATDQEAARENLMSVNDHELREDDLSNKSVFCYQNCQTAYSGGDDSELQVCRPRIHSISQSETDFALSCESRNIEDSSVPYRQQESEIDHSSSEGRTTDLQRTRLMSAEASPLMQQLQERAFPEWQNHIGVTDPAEIDNVLLSCPHWSSDENRHLNGENTACMVMETTVSDSLYKTGVIGLSTVSQPVCGVHASLDDSQSETCELGFAEQHLSMSCSEPDREPHATVLLQDDDEQVSLPNGVNHSHTTGALAVSNDTSDLHRQLHMPENITSSGWQSRDALEQEENAGYHYSGGLLDVTDRDLLHIQGGEEVEWSIMPLGGKASEDNTSVYSRADVCTHCDSIQVIENLPGSVVKESSANHAEWHSLKNTDNFFCVVEANSVVQETIRDAGMTVCLEQQQPLADADSTNNHLPLTCVCVDVSESEKGTSVYNRPQTPEVISHEPEMFVEIVEGSCSYNSVVTAHEEESVIAVLNVHEMPSSKSQNTSTDVSTSLAEIEKGLQQLGDTVFIEQDYWQRTSGTDGIAVCIPDATADDELQIGPDVAQQSVTEQIDARDERMSSETMSATCGKSINVTDDNMIGDTCAADVSGEENKPIISSVAGLDNQHLSASGTNDWSVSIMGEAAVTMQNGNSAELTSADNVHADSFSDGMSSETLRLNVNFIPDQLTPDSESTRKTVLESQVTSSEQKADKDEIHVTETKKPSDVIGCFREKFMEHSGSTVLQSSLPISEASNACEFEQQPSKNSESYDESSMSETAEENQISDSGTILPLENSVHDENSHSCIHSLGMTEVVAAEGSSGYFEDVVNGEYGANSDSGTYLDVKLCELAVDHNVKVVSSYPEQFSKPCISTNVDNFENGETSEETGQHGTLDNKKQVFPADGSSAAVTPGGSSVTSDNLHDVPSGFSDINTKEPLKDNHLTSAESEAVASGFENETVTDSDSGAVYNNNGNITKLDAVNAEFRNQAADGNIDSGKESFASEEKAVAAFSNCDSNLVIGTKVSGVAAVVDSPDNDHKSPEADESVVSEISTGTQSLLDVSAAAVTDIHDAAEPLNTTYSMLRIVIRDETNEQNEFTSKQQSAGSANAFEDDCVREMIQNCGAVSKTGNDSRQKAITEHAAFSGEELDVSHSSSVKWRSYRQSEMIANLGAVSAELVLTDTVEMSPVLAVSIGDASKFVDSSCVKDSDNFSTQREQQLCVTEGNLPIVTTESSLELVTPQLSVREVRDPLLDKLLPPDNVVATDHPLMQTDSDSVNVGANSEEKPCENVSVDAATAAGHGDAQHLPIADVVCESDEDGELSASNQFTVSQFVAEVITNAIDWWAEHNNTWQNDTELRIIPESLPQRAIADHQEELVKQDNESEHEEATAVFQSARLCDGGMTDELLRCPKFDAIASSEGQSAIAVLFHTAEGVNCSAVTDNLDAESFVTVDADGNVARQLKQPPTHSMAENHHCLVGSVEVQQSQLMYAVDDSLVTTAGGAAELLEGMSSVYITEESRKTDADMVVVADATDDNAIVPKSITGVTDVPVIADSLRDECTSECQSATSDSALAVATIKIDSDDEDDSTVLSITESGKTSMVPSVSVCYPQRAVELLNSLEVKCIAHSDVAEQILADTSRYCQSTDNNLFIASTDTFDVGLGFPAVAVSVTAALSNDADVASSVNFTVSQGKINSTEYVIVSPTVSTISTSDQIASTSAAGELTETEEYESTSGQNAANSDVSIIVTPELVMLPSSNVTDGFGTSSITGNSDADPGTGTSDLRVEKLEDANTISTSTQLSAVDGTGDNGHEQLPAMSSDVTDNDEDAGGCSTCKSEATITAAAVNNASTVCADGSFFSVVDNGFNDKNRDLGMSELEPTQENAVVSEQTEFSELPNKLGGAEGRMITVTSDAHGSSVDEIIAPDKDTDHPDIDSVTKKMSVQDYNQKHVTENQQDMTVQIDSCPPVDRPYVEYKCQSIAVRDKGATDIHSAVVAVKEKLNIVTKSTVTVVDGTTKASELGQKSLQDSVANACVSTVEQCTSNETSNIGNCVSVGESSTTSGLESTDGDSKVLSEVDSRTVARVNSAVDMAVDSMSELQVLDSALSHESHVANGLSSTAIEVEDDLQKKSDDSVSHDDRGSGPVLIYIADSRYDSVDELAVMDKSVKSNAAPDRTTMTKSIFSLQTTINYTGSHNVVAGAADTAVMQDLAENISDVEADASLHVAVGTKETGVVQQWQSPNNVSPTTSQATSSMVSSVTACAAFTGGDVSKTSLIGVVDLSEQPPSANDSSQDDQQPANRFLNDISSCYQPDTVIATSLGTSAVDEPQVSAQNAVLFCHGSSLLPLTEAQTAYKSTHSLMSPPNEIQFFETVNASLGQLSNTTYFDVITVTSQASSNKSASLCGEIRRNVSLLKEKDSDAEQMLGQNFQCTMEDHMNGAATLYGSKQAATASASDTVLEVGQKITSDLSIAEGSSIITALPQKQKIDEEYDEVAKEDSTRQKPVVLQSLAAIESPGGQTVGDRTGNTEPDHGSTASFHLPEGDVTDMLLFEVDTGQYQSSPHVTAGEMQIQQLSDVKHATVQAAFDTEVVREHHYFALDKDIDANHQHQPIDGTAIAIQATNMTANDQKIIDGHIVSKLPVPTDDTGVVNRSQLHSPTTTQQQTDYQHIQHKVPIMIGDSDCMFTGKFGTEGHLPADVSGCVQVQNAENNDLPSSSPLSGKFNTRMPSCYASSDSCLPLTEAGSIGMVSAISLGVVQGDAKSPDIKESKDSALSTVISDLKSYQSSSFPEVLDDSTAGVVENTREVDKMVDDLMVAACFQNGSTVSREQHSASLLLAANQHLSHEGVGTNFTEFSSKTVEKTCREVSGFYHDNKEHGKDVDADKDLASKQSTIVSNALCRADEYFATNMTLASVESLATADTHKSAFYDLADANSIDGIRRRHVKYSAHNHVPSVASVGLNVCDTQKVTIDNSDGDHSGMMAAGIIDHVESLDQHASVGIPYVSAETSLNVGVPVVTDAEMMAKNNCEIAMRNVESTRDRQMTFVVAHSLDDSKPYNCQQMSSDVHPRQAVSHPSQNESVRTGSKLTSGDRTALHQTSSQAAQSPTYADSLLTQVKSVDDKVQNPRSSKTKKTVGKLTDTEVLGIDLEPEKQRCSVEFQLQQLPDVEIVMSGRSTIGFGQCTDCEYHSIGLQPVGTQRPQFTPGPEQVLRDDVTEQYPESFWHSALDIEFRPRNRDNETRGEEQIAMRPYSGTYDTGDTAVQSQDKAGTHNAASKSKAVSHREVKDSIITQQNCDEDLLRGTSAVTDRESAVQQMAVDGASSVFTDNLTETLQCLSHRKPEHSDDTGNRESIRHDAASSHISHQFPALRHLAGMSQIYDVGLELFRSKSVDFADIQPNYQLVRSHSDVNIMSHRSCRNRQRRQLAQPISANSSLSKSDQELLGSTSVLFEDLLPIFKDLPLCSSLDGSDSETDEDKPIRGEFRQFENFLPWYHDLPSMPRNNATSKRQEHLGDDRAVISAIASETSYDDGVHCQDVQSDLFGMPFSRTTAETRLCQPFMMPADEYKNHRNALKHETTDDVTDRTQSMDSITYVFVGHGASRLEAVRDNRSGMAQFLSELSSYPCEDAVNTRWLVPSHSHAYGVLTESSSDSCLLSTETECRTPTQRTLSYTDLHDRTADSGGFSDDFSSDVWRIERHQIPTTPCSSEFKHNEPSAQTSGEVGFLKSDASFAASGQSEIAIQTSKSLNESHAKQPLSFSSIRRSEMEAEAQTHDSHQIHQVDSQDVNLFTFDCDGSDNVATHLMHDEKLRISVPDQNGNVMQSDTLEALAVTAAACNNVSDAHQVNKSFLSKEQSNVACRQMPQVGDSDIHQITKNHTVENWPHDDMSLRTFTTVSLPYRMDDQGQLSTEHILRSSFGRTIETQTYPEMRVIETQTPRDQETCGTQTIYWSDVESGDQIDTWMNAPLTVSVAASSPELHMPPVSRLRTELSLPSADTTSQLMILAASSMPGITTSCTDLHNASHPVVVSGDSGFTIGDPSVTTVNHASADQLSSVAALHASDTVEYRIGRSCERSLNTTVRTDLSPHHTLSQDPGLLYEHSTQTADRGSIPSTHSLLPQESLPSSGSDLARYHGLVQTTHNAASVNRTVVPSIGVASDVQSTQTTVNDRRLLVVDTTDRNLLHSATLPEPVDLGSSSSDSCCQYRAAHLSNVSHSGSMTSQSSAIQSISNMLSPASKGDLEASRTQDSLCCRTLEEEKSKLKADKILEKYRMKNADRVMHTGNEINISSPQHARLSQSALHSQASLQYSQANDSGIVDSQHSLSPLTRTLLGYSDVSCDKSATTETSRRAKTAGWYDELERLRRERQRITDMLAREVIPSRIQVGLIEAHLNYLIGQTDALLQHVDEPPASQHWDVLEADFHAFCHTRLEASQRHIEAQIQQLEKIGRESRMKAAQLSANLDSYEQRDELADVRLNPTSEHHYLTDLRSSTWSPSQREQFLLGIRREIVSATASQPVPPVGSSSSRLSTRSFRRNRGHLSAQSFPSLGPDDSIHEEEPEWCPSSLTATPATSMQHLDCRRHSTVASSVDGEINSLLTECQEARQRARIEIGRAMDAIQRTSPAWASSPLSSHRQLSFSTSQLFERDRNELISTRADLSLHRPYSFYATSSDLLNTQQRGVTGNIQASSVDNVSDMDTRWYHSVTDGCTQRYDRDFNFNRDRQAPTVAGSTPVRPPVRQPYPVSSRHSNLHSSSDCIWPSSDHTFAD